MKKITFTDVNPLSRSQILLIEKKIKDTINAKDFILGRAVENFERNFSNLTKLKFSIGCGSGTDALFLSLLALNIKKDDEVIIPGMSYVATGLPVVLNNSRIVFSDIDKNTGLISLDDIKKKISKKTKAIIPVSLYGQKVDTKKLRKIVGKRIYIIEDNAQSHFAYSCFNCKRNYGVCCKKERNEKYADISCYSFYPSKNLGAYGDGGIISTNNIKIYKKLKSLRNLGSIKKNVHTLKGKNSRLDTIQAVVLNEKLQNILSLNDKRRKIAKFYDKKFNNFNKVLITKTNPGSVRHLYVLRVKNRKKLIKYLKKNKVNCQTHYPYSLNKLKPLIQKKKYKLVNSESWAKTCISIPIHPKMMIGEANYIVNKIKDFYYN